jgi:hypothetical protein
MWKQANVNGYQVFVYLPASNRASFSNLEEPLCWITYGEYEGGYVSLKERFLSHPSRKKISIPNDVAMLIKRWIDLQLLPSSLMDRARWLYQTSHDAMQVMPLQPNHSYPV